MQEEERWRAFFAGRASRDARTESNDIERSIRKRDSSNPPEAWDCTRDWRSGIRGGGSGREINARAPASVGVSRAAMVRAPGMTMAFVRCRSSHPALVARALAQGGAPAQMHSQPREKNEGRQKNRQDASSATIDAVRHEQATES